MQQIITNHIIKNTHNTKILNQNTIQTTQPNNTTNHQNKTNTNQKQYILIPNTHKNITQLITNPHINTPNTNHLPNQHQQPNLIINPTHNKQITKKIHIQINNNHNQTQINTTTIITPHKINKKQKLHILLTNQHNILKQKYPNLQLHTIKKTTNHLTNQ